jgi:hypothetical protein
MVEINDKVTGLRASQPVEAALSQGETCGVGEVMLS